MAKPAKELTEKEIAERRDKALLRALKMPPKPHDEIKGKSKKKPIPKKKPTK